MTAFNRIQVNPRASRTVPFVSKVTGVPMVELAVRIALGVTLHGLGWPGGLLPPPPFVAVKAPAFSTAKLRGVDPSVGPFMQSTGEVIGIHMDPRVALAKALRGAALVPPRAVVGEGAEVPVALLSIADRDKATLPRLATALVTAGDRIAATPGTAAALTAHGFAADVVAKLGEEASGADLPGILDLIREVPFGWPRTRRPHAPAPFAMPPRSATSLSRREILCLTAIPDGYRRPEALNLGPSPELSPRCAPSRTGSLPGGEGAPAGHRPSCAPTISRRQDAGMKRA